MNPGPRVLERGTNGKTHLHVQRIALLIFEDAAVDSAAGPMEDSGVDDFIAGIEKDGRLDTAASAMAFHH